MAARIVHLCNVFLPADHPDAGRLSLHPGRWVLNLAMAQRAHAGLDARIVMHVPGASRDHAGEMDGVPVRFVAAPDRLRAATLFHFDAKRLARAALEEGPDLVHAHGTEDAYCLAAQRTGKPVAITVQGLYFLINRELRPRAISRERIVEWTERVALSRALDVVAKSDYVGAALVERFPHLRIHRIPNTFDPRLLDVPWGEREDAVAFVGTLCPRKGVDLIAEAMGLLGPGGPELWVFGDKPASAATSYETGLKERLVAATEGRVRFYGVMPTLEMARILVRAHTLVAPSREEMFGNQLIEALLLGLHGVVSDATAMAENVRRYGGGTVVPQEDAGAIARALVEARHEPTAARTAREKVVCDLGPERVAAAHAELYRALLGGAAWRHPGMGPRER